MKPDSPVYLCILLKFIFYLCLNIICIKYKNQETTHIMDFLNRF